MMQNTQDMIQRLNLSGSRLSKSHRRIAEYILQHYDKAVFMTAAKLGEMVNVSESTVVRFAVALGYEGYPELQQALQELVRHRLTATQRFEMSSDISQEEVLSTVLKADMQNIRSTIDGIDNAAFLRAVQVISGARRIYILGLRSAAPLAQFAGYYLHYIFDDVRVVAAGSTDVFEAISRIEASDVLLGISFPRYSSRTIEAMSFARSRHAQVIGLTDGPMSPLHEVADICLSMRTDMASFVDSMAAPMSVINALIVALGIQNREALNARFKQLEEVWDAYSVYMNEGK
ncbi:MAG: MurR/RpiR family transcriptional regulator [Clostridiales bacterium]|nr:MurR/RpiR family transcriptional regulator [Eubacteriales bacterium]MCI5766665.1 MurR/RpiR family transcriptional regulator [Clostridiales bacterium]MDD7121969.1 MurR/RpiR family transcriptional regulator [Clostridiales bacterium]MDY5468589.1 MurR/RpiR family transcriptional regulator [Eubacteriales bacterium]